MQFKPCVSRSACTEDGTHCRACGRAHEEIIRTRILINSVSAFTAEMGYENTEEFFNYFVNKLGKKLKHIQEDVT